MEDYCGLAADHESGRHDDGAGERDDLLEVGVARPTKTDNPGAEHSLTH